MSSWVTFHTDGLIWDILELNRRPIFLVSLGSISNPFKKSPEQRGWTRHCSKCISLDRWLLGGKPVEELPYQSLFGVWKLQLLPTWLNWSFSIAKFCRQKPVAKLAVTTKQTWWSWFRIEWIQLSKIQFWSDLRRKCLVFFPTFPWFWHCVPCKWIIKWAGWPQWCSYDVPLIKSRDYPQKFMYCMFISYNLLQYIYTVYARL